MDAFVSGLPVDLDADARRVVIERAVAERNFPKILNIIEAREPGGEPKEVFVCSFTADGTGDRLSQWRGYSYSSQGFSVGFERTLLKKQLELQGTLDTPVELVECIYDEATMLERIKDLGCTAAAGFRSLRTRDEAVPPWFCTLLNPSDSYRKIFYYLLKFLTMATVPFYRAAAQFKHFGFREELEWRVVYFAFRKTLLPNIIKFRDGQFGLTPYVEIPLGFHKPTPVRSDELSSAQELIMLRIGRTLSAWWRCCCRKTAFRSDRHRTRTGWK